MRIDQIFLPPRTRRNLVGFGGGETRRKRSYAARWAMTNRFRVSSTLPRKLEELGLTPGAVLRQASSNGVVCPGQDPGEHRRLLCTSPRNSGSQQRSGNRLEARNRGAR